jgi:uncharacterized LabA/DUF88 family protein
VTSGGGDRLIQRSGVARDLEQVAVQVVAVEHWHVVQHWMDAVTRRLTRTIGGRPRRQPTIAGSVLLNVYVDGFNVYYGCLRGTPFKWLDLGALCRRLFPRDTIHRIRYFTAIVSARPNDPRQPQRQLAYLRALATIPEVTIHRGRYLTHPTRMALAHPVPGGPATVEVIKAEEKGSDVNLATYLLFDAFRKDCETAVVVSNDSDLKEPIELVQRELGMSVGAVNPHPPGRRSRALQPSYFRQIRAKDLHVCQFPPTLRDARGTIHKPTTW